MIELNLLPDVKKEFIKDQRTRNSVISGAILVSIIAVGVIALLATTVYGAQKVLKDNLNKDILSNHKKVEEKQEINKYLAIQSQLKYLDEAAKQRSVYARFFDYLPQLNPAAPYNITLYEVKLTKDTTTINMTGVAGNFEAVNNFKNTLERAKFSYKDSNDEAQEVALFTEVVSTAPSLATTDGQIKALFDFTITFAPEAFDPASKDPKINVPKLVTSDGDQNAPKELFGIQPQPATGQGGDNGGQ